MLSANKPLMESASGTIYIHSHVYIYKSEALYFRGLLDWAGEDGASDDRPGPFTKPPK